ncbi:MAG: hypothetical protein KA831_04850 [Pyrinomonadaceae bacterium]|nr:hypothetical protein [Pyrinomonadaceae bacterium]
MALRQCDKCSEMVDEAKAFCPECGNVLVEEKQREEESAYESMDGTMQFGQTMYNQMLSDMGLNISAAPNKKFDEPQPAAPEVIEPARPPVQPVLQVLQPIETGVATTPVTAEKPAGGVNRWLIIGGVGAVLLLILLVAAILIGFALWSRVG